MSTLRHVPVFHAFGHRQGEDSLMMQLLAPKNDDIVIDCTLGLAGHAKAFLEKTAPAGHLYGLDADADNIALANENLSDFQSRCTLIHSNFRHLPELHLPPANIIFADLGLSSAHVDDPERGFSFRTEGPLDLRFDRSTGITAAEYIAQTNESDLKYMFRRFGELKEANRIAHALFAAARHEVLRTTTDLVRVCDETFGYRAPALLPQIFQALRMQVNDELGALEKLLATAPYMLKPGGRFGIITFHSLEDRLVKRTFKNLAQPEIDEITGQIRTAAPFDLLTRKPLTPTAGEISLNPRARSAHFRAIIRTEQTA